jgi:hypothetical protein
MTLRYLCRMKVQPFHEELSGGVQAFRLTRSLATMLSLWTSPPPWQGRARSDAPFESSEHAILWAALVTRSRPAEPVSTIDGLADAVRRHNALLAENGVAWSFEQLQAEGLARVEGRRAGVRSPIGLQPTVPRAHTWRARAPWKLWRRAARPAQCGGHGS